MRVYEVHQFSNFPKRNPKTDKLIKEFDYEKEAIKFSMEYNIEKVTNAMGEIVYFPCKSRTADGKRMTYKYLHEGNDSYYVEELIPIPKKVTVL